MRIAVKEKRWLGQGERERMNTRVIKAEDTRKMDRERTELNTCHCHPLGIPRWLLCPGIGLGGQATSSHSSLMKTKCFQNHRGRLP